MKTCNVCGTLFTHDRQPQAKSCGLCGRKCPALLPLTPSRFAKFINNIAAMTG